MSEDSSSPGSSGAHPPLASKRSTLTVSSDEEDSEDQQDESSLEESLSSLEDESEELMDEQESLEDTKFMEKEYLEKEENLEEGDYLEEEKYLEDDDYLDEKTFLQRETYLFKETFEEKTYSKEKAFKKHLEKKLKTVGTAEGQPSLKERTPVPSTVHVINLVNATPPSSDHDLKFTASSYYNLGGISVSLRDQSSQTEWVYKRTPLRSKTVLDQGSSSSMLANEKSDMEAESFFPHESFWDTLLSGSFDKREEEVFESLPASYHSVFKEIVSELASHHELEEDLDIPLNNMMEGENKKKLGLLFKKKFEKYKEIIMWIIKKQSKGGQMIPEKTTTVSYLVSTLLQSKESETKHSVRSASTFKRLKLDKDWIKAKMKEHQGDGKLVVYRSGRNFHILFPNATGQIYYPSGNLALLITRKGVAKVTYIVLEDCVEKKIRGLVTNSGHATFFNEDGGIWLSLSKILGYYFPSDNRQKAWNWWNLSIHVHAPPVMCITLKLNKYIHIQIRSQDKVIFCFFVPKQKKICLNMGTKFKLINLKLLQAMKNKVVLETDPYPTWKIQALLGKISRSLNFLTLSELEEFTAEAEVALNNLSARKSRILL